MFGTTSRSGVRGRGLATAAGLALAAPVLLLSAGTALAARPTTTTEPPITTTEPPPPPTTTTEPPPPPPTAPPPTAPPPTTTAPPPPPPPPPSQLRPPDPSTPGQGASRFAGPPSAPATPATAASPAVPAATPPVDPVAPAVLNTTLAAAADADLVPAGGSTRSTLPEDFGAIQQTSAFVPSRGFSPEDVLVLALAAVAGFALVVWEVVEESQWST